MVESACWVVEQVHYVTWQHGESGFHLNLWRLMAVSGIVIICLKGNALVSAVSAVSAVN